MRKKPNESKNAADPPSASIELTILNPPGVSTIANESQNPPYDDNAVAPKVFPIAISLQPTTRH